MLVVIPSYNRSDLVEEAVAAVQPLQALVVDDSPTGLRRPQGAAVLLRTAGGTGFARAANAGLAAAQRAGWPWVLLLNDDARPAPGCVAALWAAAGTGGDNVLAGPVLLDPAGRVESAGIHVSVRSGRVRAGRRVPAASTEVDALSGACLLLPSHCRFDGRFPFSFEDVDLCLRVRAGGGRVVLVPQARCVHLGGGTVPRGSRLATRYALEGHLHLLRHRPWLWPVAGFLAVAQVVRDRGGMERLRGIGEGVRSSLA